MDGILHDLPEEIWHRKALSWLAEAPGHRFDPFF
jgi:hypothetical protein